MCALLYSGGRLTARVVFLMGALACATVSFGQPAKASNYVAGEVLVKFDRGTASRQAHAANRKVGAVVLEELGGLGWQRVRLPQSMTTNRAIEIYRSLEGVETAQPNYYYHLVATPSDPLFGDPGMYGLQKISAPSAWDLTTGSSTVVVADIDTGLRYTHEDLAANTWVNPGEISGNGVDDDNNGYVDDIYGVDTFYNDGDPWDEHGHGTHTAGTIGAIGNNALGVVGVNWNVRVMAIKIYDSDGYGTTSAMLINAYNYVRTMKERGVNVRVTNNSYGGCDEACGYDQATKDAIDALGDAGVLQVFAAGNNGTDNDLIPFYPATYTSPSILAVASSNTQDNKSGFSDFGLISVDLAAPGSGILSTAFDSNSSYGTKSGTSMATPHGAGAAALLAAFNPQLSVASLKATLMNTVDQLPQWTGLVRSGGRLNVDRALRSQTVCNITPSISKLTAPTKGGTFTINVAAAQNCDYSARTTVPWIRLVDADAFSGNATLTFRVLVNATIRRSGTVNIGGSEITVTQARDQ